MKLVLIGAFLSTHAFGLSTLQYAQKCEEKIRVRVPPFNCNDAEATSIKATENGREIPEGPTRQARCDTPSHGGSACQTGTRILKYTDIIRKGGVEERISTVIMCRREPPRGPTPGDSGDSGDRFSDVAVIQLNETKNLSCWFSKQGMPDSTKVPSPSEENPNPNYWGPSQPNMNCMSCHDGATFIYSPLVAQIKGTRGGYTKRPGDTGYAKGGGNEIPRSGLKVGPSCAFDMPGQPTPQTQLKLNLAAYERKFGASDRTKALPTTCTECHYIGKGGLGCSMALDSMTGSARNPLLSDGARRGVNFRWMPPQESRPYWPRNFWTAEGFAPSKSGGNAAVDKAYAEQAEAYFEPAKKAVTYCCDNPTDREVCGERFAQTPADTCFGLNPAAALRRGGTGGGDAPLHSDPATRPGTE